MRKVAIGEAAGIALLMVGFLTACGHSGPSAPNLGPNGGHGNVGDSQGPTCASGRRVIKNTDYEKESASGVSQAKPGYEFLEQLGLGEPGFCANVTDQQLMDAARQLPAQFPPLCSGYPAQARTCNTNLASIMTPGTGETSTQLRIATS